MPREDRRDVDDPGRLPDAGAGDFGQADYSMEYGYDPRARAGYRVDDDEREQERAARVDAEPRAFSGPVESPSGPRVTSDRVLWAVITQRLADARRLDAREVTVAVQGGEVVLDGVVRRKADKRRIEDIADVEGVRNVQNNLRVREGGVWSLFRRGS